ncbi:hypothetical protein MKW98_000427, partial [Papaver atlanticum]
FKYPASLDGPTGDKTHLSTRVMGTYGYAAPTASCVYKARRSSNLKQSSTIIRTRHCPQHSHTDQYICVKSE